MAEYKDRAFSVAQRYWYRVDEGFPMITQSDVRSGVVDVKYSILLAACEPFRVSSPHWQDISELSNG